MNEFTFFSYKRSQLYVTSQKGVIVILLTETEIRTGKEEEEEEGGEDEKEVVVVEEEEEEEEEKETCAKCQMLCITEIPIVLKGTSHRLCF